MKSSCWYELSLPPFANTVVLQLLLRDRERALSPVSPLTSCHSQELEQNWEPAAQSGCPTRVARQHGSTAGASKDAHLQEGRMESWDSNLGALAWLVGILNSALPSRARGHQRCLPRRHQFSSREFAPPLCSQAW